MEAVDAAVVTGRAAYQCEPDNPFVGTGMTLLCAMAVFGFVSMLHLQPFTLGMTSAPWLCSVAFHCFTSNPSPWA